MEQESVKTILSAAKAVQDDAYNLDLWLPFDEGMLARGEMVLPRSLTRGTRGYIEKVTNQVNGTYENGLYDACAVMIRRLVETLIIEAFEHHKVGAKIKNPSTSDYFYLGELITRTLAETTWTLGRNTKIALPKLKDIGDLSAHSRRFNAHRADIDELKYPLRVATQELLCLAGLK